MPLSLDQFIGHVASTELLTVAEIEEFIAAQPADKRPADAEALARALFKAGKLTEYQTKQLYAGKPGSVVVGDYVLLGEIGAGGMGVVYKAEHRRMKRVVAIKALPRAATGSPQAVKRFYREVEAAARLNHSHIVAAYDAREVNGLHYLVMEFVDGEDLSSVLKTRGKLDVAESLRYIAQAARGLEYAHSQGVYHRDIKPGNLLLDKQGTIKILDMGLARFEGSATSPDGDAGDGLTKTNQVMGTVDYMAPEQAENTRQADHRSDIYALGCTLYRLLAGETMYGGETVVQRIIAHREHPIPSLRAVCPAAPEGLDAVFQRMVAKKAAQRYQSMTEVLAALEPFLKDASSKDAAELTLAGGSKTMVSATLVKPGVTATAPTAAAAPAVVASLALEPTLQRATTSARPADETLNYQREGDTSPSLPPNVPSTKPKRDWKKIAMIAGAVLLVLILLGRAQRAKDEQNKEGADPPVAQTEGTQPEGPPTPPNPEPETTPPSKPPETKSDAKSPPETSPVRPAPPAAAPIDLLALIEPKRDGFRGDWELRDGVLLSPLPEEVGLKFKSPPAETSAVLEAPYDPPEDYDLTLVVEYERGRGPLIVGLPDRFSHWFVTLESPASVLRFLKRKGPTPGAQIPAKGTVEVKFRVRKDSREVLINDKAVHDPDGAVLGELPFVRSSELASRKGLLVGSVAARYRITRLELTPLGTGGKTLR